METPTGNEDGRECYLRAERQISLSPRSVGTCDLGPPFQAALKSDCLPTSNYTSTQPNEPTIGLDSSQRLWTRFG